MSEEHPPETMQQKREATIDQLREHYAQDDLGIDEFEQRVDNVPRAPSVADLEKLVSEMRYPGESEKEAKQRRKAEKRARKRVHE